MRFQILHDIPGRIRLRADARSMSTEQADVLEAWIKTLPGVDRVTVHERTRSVTVLYHGDRRKLYGSLASFSYESAEKSLGPQPSGSRLMNREYKEKLVFLVIRHFARRFLLPNPLRRVLAVCRSCPRIIKGLKAAAAGHLTVEVLDGIAIGTSLVTGDYTTAGSVNFLLRVGEILDEWTHKKSVDDLARSMSLQVDQVWKLGDNDTPEMTPLGVIVPGDRIVVHTGHVLPLDGILEHGDVMLNQASLTGESVPVAKHPGAAVYAGSVLEEGSCVVRVTHATGENRYDRIVRMIEESERLKSGVENRAGHLADSLVPWCLGGSILTYLLTGNTTRAVSVLMVDFSCALKLSMPLSVLSAMREAGGHHITVKGGRFMEKISEADTVIFDKTGTLTKACPTVAAVVPFNRENAREMLRMAACLEEHFPHSVANAVVKAAKEQGLSHREMHSEVEYVVAHGIATRINGRRAVIGSSHFVFEDEGVLIRPEDQERFYALPESVSWLYFGIGGVLCAAIGISDPLRPEARNIMEALRREGIAKTVMLTGDNRRVAGAISADLALDDYRAEVLPEDKAAYIRREHEAGRTVIMVGDGINDTPALSLSDVGVAVGSGAVIAREVADVTIETEDIRELVWLKRLSDALMGRIHRNYRFVMGFNGTLIALGALGLITPAASAFLHNSSTILLSMNCLTALLEKESAIIDDNTLSLERKGPVPQPQRNDSLTRKEQIKNAYKLTGSKSGFYDGMMTYSTLPGKAICRLIWNMDGQKNLRYLEKALSGVPQDFKGKLLEVPVGTGVLSMPVYADLPDADITCLDYSEKMMASAQEKAEAMGITNIRFVQGDVGALPFEDKSFDVVLSLNGFHAFPDKEAAYRETYRVLKKGGIFCGCFYIKGECGRTDWFIDHLYGPKGFFTPPYETRESLRQQLEQRYEKVKVTAVEGIGCFRCRK